MIGHQQIIAARNSGFKPAAIFIDAGLAAPTWRCDFDNPERALDYGFYPTVTIPPEELGHRHDLRFLAACRVHVVGHVWSDQIYALVDAIACAGAVSIIVWCADGSKDLLEFKNGEWIAYAD